MINPLEVVIQFLKSNDIANGHVSSKSQYGGLWEFGTDGVVVGLDGGPAELYLPVTIARLEVRAYSQSQLDAYELLGTIDDLAVKEREIVTTDSGSGLLYYLLPDSGPSLLYDPQLKMDFGLKFFSAMIYSEAIGVE